MGEITFLHYNVGFVIKSLMLPIDKLIILDLVGSRCH
jgi:hypothetical protein